MSTRRCHILSCLMGLLCAAVAIPLHADKADFYLSWSGLMDQFADPNVGLTVLNTLLLPMGGNAEAMGTAFTAVADDAGYIEANPAASSRLKITELSLMHRYLLADVSLDSLVYTTRLNNLGLGAAAKFLPVRFTEYDSWGEAQSKAYITESVLILNAAYSFLDSYYRLGTYYFEGVALGANLKVAHRGIPETLAAGQSGLGVMVDVGALTRFNLLKTYTSRSANFSVGAALKNLGPYVLQEPLPTLFTVGVAYAVVRPILLSLDINVPFSFRPNLYPAERINVATGIDVKVADFLAIQSGLWLRGSNPRATLGVALDLSKTSLAINASIDRQGPKFSVEAKVDLGDRGRGARQAEIDTAFAESVKAYAEGDYDKAIRLAQKVLDLRPDHKHRHAELILKLADEAEKTQEDLQRKQAEAAGILEKAVEGAQGATTEAGTELPTRSPAQEGLDN